MQGGFELSVASTRGDHPASAANGIGVFGQSENASSFGGVFVGGLVVSGGPKSAAAPGWLASPVYTVESPENWFEDFGRAKLARGRAEVKLDPNFVGFVRSDDFHVFLSPEKQSKGLYVSRRKRGGFSVREQGEGTNTTTFSYRIVARRN